MSLRVVCQGLQHADLDGAPGASRCLGGAEQPVQQTGGMVDRAGVVVRPVLRDQQPDQGEVVELAADS